MYNIEEQLEQISIVSPLVWKILRLSKLRYSQKPSHIASIGIKKDGLIILTLGTRFYNMSLQEQNYVLAHEAGHIIRFLWDKRTIDDISPKLDNNIQDMCINHDLNNGLFVSSELASMPLKDEYQVLIDELFELDGKEDDSCLGVLPPDEYTGDITYESLYLYTKDKDEYQDLKGFDELFELDGEIDLDAIEQLKGELAQYARDAGLGETIVQTDPFSPYILLLQQIKRMSGRGRKKAVSKPHKYYPELVGYTSANRDVNIILDTSGSMKTLAPRILGYVIDQHMYYNLVTFDSQAYSIGKRIKGKKLLQMELQGGGGTTLLPALDLIREQKKQKSVTIILTDGYIFDGYISLEGFKNIFIISTEEKVNIHKNKSALKKQIIMKGVA